MARERRGVQGIRTMGALVDSRRTRTAAGALLELSAMANEKLLLTKELERWKVRHVEIRRRLAEIATKERRLMAYVQGEAVPGDPAAPSAAPSDRATSAIEQPTQDWSAEPPPGRRVTFTEFNY